MVKRIIIPVLLLLLGYAPQNAVAQNRLTDQGNRLLDECRTLFSQGDYGAAGTVLAEWEALKRSTGVVRSEEIDYMRTVISAENDLAGSLDMILGFMEKYPQSIYYNHMEALLGSSYFACREYRKALECFDETDPLLLEDRDSRRLVRHNAVSMIRCGQTDEGYVQLSILERLVSNPETDEDIVFYKAYVDYARGNMDKVLRNLSEPAIRMRPVSIWLILNCVETETMPQLMRPLVRWLNHPKTPLWRLRLSVSWENICTARVTTLRQPRCLPAIWFRT